MSPSSDASSGDGTPSMKGRGRASAANYIAIRSAARWRVLDAALGPQLVQPAVDLERRAHADVALKRFAVVADLLDDVNGPILGQAELLTVVAFSSDETLDLRVWRLHRLVEGLRGNAKLLGIDHGKERPLHDVEPLIVAMPDHRPERLLRDDLRQNHVVVRICDAKPFGIERGGVGRIGVAASRIVGFHRLVCGG